METIQEELTKEDETIVTNKSNAKVGGEKEKTKSKKTKTKENNPEKFNVPPFQLDIIIPARAFSQYCDARKVNPADSAMMEGLIHFFHNGMQHVTSHGGMKLVVGHLEKDINWFNLELEKCGF